MRSSCTVFKNVTTAYVVCFRKGRKNEKKPIVEEKKLYLDPELLQHPILKKDVVQVIRKPPYIDEKEWIATHSKWLYLKIFLTLKDVPSLQNT